MTGHQRSSLYLFGFLFLWAFVELIGAILLARYSAFQLVWIRYLVHLLLLLAIFGWHRPGRLVQTRRPGFQLMRSMMMLIMPASWVLGLRMDAGSLVIGWFWSVPLLIVLLSALLLRERASRAIALAAAAGGLAAVALFNRVTIPAGAQWLPVIGMAGSFALYVVMTRSLRGERLRANLFYTALGVFVALTPVLPRVWQTPGARDLVLFAAVGGFGLVALWCLDRAVAHAPAADIAPLFLAQVPFSFLLGWMAGHHTPGTTGMLLLATMCIACAVPLVRIHSNNRVGVSR